MKRLDGTALWQAAGQKEIIYFALRKTPKNKAFPMVDQLRKECGRSVSSLVSRNSFRVLRKNFLAPAQAAANGNRLRNPLIVPSRMIFTSVEQNAT